jgi:alkanesulfonate monooxygenase SsuD/methylene tetrahydromethanopterin reductase-like flavin-dependent oxidoreductase (luciferase family)
VRIGILVPSFVLTADQAIAVSQEAEKAGLHGVFAYDHLWPMGSPTRPSLAPFPVLAAVAARCASLYVGPLVARVGMVATSHLVGQFRSLATLAPGRVIAAVGTGDTKSRDELEGYGLVFASADDRRAEVEAVAVALKDEMSVWIGAGAEATNELARRLDVVLNVWDASADTVAVHIERGPVTWAGPVPEDLHGWLDTLMNAGVDWAVFAPGVDVASLANWRHPA